MKHENEFSTYYREETKKNLSNLEHFILDKEIEMFRESRQFVKMKYTKGKLMCIAYMVEEGVWTISYQWMDKLDKGVCSETLVYKWDRFEIKEFFFLDVEDNKEQFFNYELEVAGQNTPYYNATRDDIFKRLCQDCVVSFKDRFLIKALINDYLKVLKIPEVKITTYFGFTREHGWVLPFPEEYGGERFQIVSGSKIHKKVSKLMEDNLFNPEFTEEMIENVPKLIQDFHKATGIQYKDICFAFAIGSPFFDALKEESGITPHVYSSGPESTGKTSLWRKLSVGFWGYWDEMLGDESKSDAQLSEICSATTFLVVIDEAENIKSADGDKLKRHSTGSPVVIKLLQNGAIRLNGAWRCAFGGTYNHDEPCIFSDIAYKSRCVVLPHESCEKHPDWTQIASQLKKGLVGRYIYEKTKKWDLEKVRRLFFAQSSKIAPINDKIDNRARNIIQLFEFGKDLAKRLFDLDLDLKDLSELIANTAGIGNEKIPSLIQDQIYQGLRIGSTYNKTTSSWVKRNILEYTFKGVKGVFYSSENALDLYRMVKDKNVEKLSGLKAILGAFWKPREEIIISTFSVERRPKHGMFIPEKFYSGEYDMHKLMEEAEKDQESVSELEIEEPTPRSRGKVIMDMDVF